MLFIAVLFAIVLLILAYSLSSDKGKNTAHARRTNPVSTPAKVQHVAHSAKQGTLHAN